MKYCQLSVLVLSCFVASSGYSLTALEDKSTAKSTYFTGKAGAAKIEYRSLDQWLEHRAKDDLPKDIYNRGFIIDKPGVVKPLYDITNRLLKNWPGAAPNMAIFVRADMKASVYGAETLIANEMLIYYGSLINAETDDELAAIVAHELAHILLGHNAKANYANIAFQRLQDYENVKNLRNSVESGHFVKTNDKQYTLKFDPGLTRDIIKASEQKARAAELYTAYHGSVLGRPAEIKADLLAADLLIKAGYSPMGLYDSLSRLSGSYTVEKFVSKALAQSAKKTMAAVEKTMNEEIDLFEKQVATFETTGEANFTGMGSLLSFSSFSKGLKKQLSKAATDFAWERFKTSHPVPQKRVSNLANYLDQNYSLRQRQKSKSKQFLKAYQRSGIASMSGYKKLEMASLDLMQGDIDKAASQSIASLVGANDKDPYKRFTAHRIRRDQKRSSSAIINIEKITNYQAVPNSAVIEMLDLLIENRKLTASSKIIAQKERYNPDISEFYPAKIAIALGHKKADEAKLVASECVSSKKVSKKIKGQCVEFGLLNADESTAGNNAIIGGFKSATSVLKKSLNPFGKEK